LYSEIEGLTDKDCPECTRREFDLSPEAVAVLVDQIPISPEMKADDDVRAERLAACSACDAFRGSVLCAHCGCFVLFRARVRKSYCPHPAGEKWPMAK